MNKWIPTIVRQVYHHDERFKTRSNAKHQVFEYIEAHYHRKRLHSKLDCLSPIAFEAKKVT